MTHTSPSPAVTPQPPQSNPPGKPAGSTASGALTRITSLARAEITLLLRNRNALFVALLMPVAMVVLFRSSAGELDLSGTGMSSNDVVMTGGIAMVLLLVVYLNLVPTFVSRREERVLKRLRTGELNDAEILAGTVTPAVLLALSQCVILVLAGSLLLDVSFPSRPDLLIAGVLLGLVMLVLLAAATSAYTKTVESAQITGMPVFLLAIVGSGIAVPLEVMSDSIANVLRFLPVTPVMELVRGGWLGGLEGSDQIQALGLAVAWTAIAFYLVRDKFRWDPRG